MSKNTDEDDLKPGVSHLNGDQTRSLTLIRQDTALVEYRAAPPEPHSHYSQQTPTLRDYILILFRQKTVIASTIFMTIVIAFLGINLHTPKYEAQAKMLIRAEKLIDSPYYKSTDNAFKTEIVLTQSEIVKSRPVLERAVQELRLDERPLDYESAFATPMKQFWMDLKDRMRSKTGSTVSPGAATRLNIALAKLRMNTRVKPVPNTNLFSISVKDFDPIMAARIANTVAHYYIIFDMEQILAGTTSKYGEKNLIVRQLRDEIQKYEDQLYRTTVSYADTLGPASVKILESASPPLTSDGHPAVLILLIAAVSGFLLGVALAFAFERLDPTFRSAEDVKKVLNRPVLGSIPIKKYGFKYLKSKPMISSRYTRAFKDLADCMIDLINHQGVRSVLVTSCLPREGSSMVAANLALQLSRAGEHKILLVDANFSKPVLSKVFKLPKSDGLYGVLSGKASLADSVRRVNDSLDVLTTRSFDHSPIAHWNVLQLSALIGQRIIGSYNMILIDASNLRDSKDAEALLTALDGALLVMDPNRARREVIRAALEALERKKSNIFGVVLNKRIYHMPQMLYGQV